MPQMPLYLHDSAVRFTRLTLERKSERWPVTMSTAIIMVKTKLSEHLI